MCGASTRVAWSPSAWVASGPAGCSRRRSSTCRAEGLRVGSFVIMRRSRAQRLGSMPSRSGSRVAMLMSTATEAPSPKGGRPVIENARSEPRANTSLAGPMGSSVACSGESHAGLPVTRPVAVSEVASSGWAIPKSMSCGPVGLRMMLPGLRSRWVMRCWSSTASAWAMPRARRHQSSSDRGPFSVTSSRRVGPLTYSMANQAGSDSRSAARNWLMWSSWTDLRTATSRRNLSRVAGASRRPGRITFRATPCHSGDEA